MRAFSPGLEKTWPPNCTRSGACNLSKDGCLGGAKLAWPRRGLLPNLQIADRCVTLVPTSGEERGVQGHDDLDIIKFRWVRAPSLTHLCTWRIRKRAPLRGLSSKTLPASKGPPSLRRTGAFFPRAGRFRAALSSGNRLRTSAYARPGSRSRAPHGARPDPPSKEPSARPTGTTARGGAAGGSRRRLRGCGRADRARRRRGRRPRRSPAPGRIYLPLCPHQAPVHQAAADRAMARRSGRPAIAPCAAS